MMLQRAKQRLGLSISRDLVAAAYSLRNESWTDAERRLPNEPLSESIERLLSRLQAPRRFHRDVVAILNTDQVRVREIAGLPPGLSMREVELLVKTNWSRFFVSPFQDSVVSSVQHVNDGWKTALADRSIVREIFDGCSRAGWHLSTIIADPTGFDHSHNNASSPISNDVEQERERAVRTSHYKRRTLVEIVPDEVVARTNRARAARIRIAASLFVAAMATAWVAPRIRSALQLRSESERIVLLNDRTATLQSKLDSITRITSALEAVHQLNIRSASVLAQIADLESVLPDDVLLQQIRIDSSATEIAISAETVSDAIKRIALKYPDVEMIGMVSTESSAQPTERALLRIARVVVKPKQKSRGSW